MWFWLIIIPSAFFVVVGRWFISRFVVPKMDRLWNFIGASLINKGSEGSIKCKSHKKDNCPVCILMPNQKNPVKRVGLDIGKRLKI